MINLMKSKSETIIKEAEQATNEDALDQSIEVIDPTIFNSKFSNDVTGKPPNLMSSFHLRK